MTTIRRIYAYLLAFAGLAIVAIAAANLAQLLIDVVLHASITSSDGYVRNTAALHGAAALVGLPVWWLHWRWIERTVQADPPERTSALRALYLYVVLAGAAIALAVSFNDALRHLFEGLVDVPVGAGGTDAVLRPLPFSVVGAVVWLAHWRLAATDRAVGDESSRVAVLRRLYLYGASFVGLLVLLVSTQAVIENLWHVALSAFGSTAARSGADSAVGLAAAALAAPLATALVGLGVWLSHWLVLPARLARRAMDLRVVPDEAARPARGGLISSDEVARG